jgi:hypothetical protein
LGRAGDEDDALANYIGHWWKSLESAFTTVLTSKPNLEKKLHCETLHWKGWAPPIDRPQVLRRPLAILQFTYPRLFRTICTMHSCTVVIG